MSKNAIITFVVISYFTVIIPHWFKLVQKISLFERVGGNRLDPNRWDPYVRVEGVPLEKIMNLGKKLSGQLNQLLQEKDISSFIGDPSCDDNEDPSCDDDGEDSFCDDNPVTSFRFCDSASAFKNPKLAFFKNVELALTQYSLTLNLDENINCYPVIGREDSDQPKTVRDVFEDIANPNGIFKTTLNEIKKVDSNVNKQMAETGPLIFYYAKNILINE